MLELQGKYNTAKVFTDVVDEASIAQVIQLCNQEFVQGQPHPANARRSRRRGLHGGHHHDDHR